MAQVFLAQRSLLSCQCPLRPREGQRRGQVTQEDGYQSPGCPDLLAPSSILSFNCSMYDHRRKRKDENSCSYYV